MYEMRAQRATEDRLSASAIVRVHGGRILHCQLDGKFVCVLECRGHCYPGAERAGEFRSYPRPCFALARIPAPADASAVIGIPKRECVAPGPELLEKHHAAPGRVPGIGVVTLTADKMRYPCDQT